MRTVLYANPKVAEEVRQHFVLHWSSERPVPVITIDFGDGRLVRRTLTGNSVHYILDKQGRVVDALPGLYPAGTFLKEVGKARDLALSAADLDARDFDDFLYQHHGSRKSAAHPDAISELEAVSRSGPRASRDGGNGGKMETGLDAYTKLYHADATLGPATLRLMWRDMPEELRTPLIVASIAPFHVADAGSALLLAGVTRVEGRETATHAERLSPEELSARRTRNEEHVWGRYTYSNAASVPMSMLHGTTAGNESIVVEYPTALEALEQAMTKAGPMGEERVLVNLLGHGAPVVASAGRFYSEADAAANPFVAARRVSPNVSGRRYAVEHSLTKDAANNELVLRPRIWSYLIHGDATTVDDLNRYIFSRVFLTPAEDPWLGLHSPDMWTGIRNDGIIVSDDD